MAVITHDAKLNDLLVDLGRSLLQYADESWPWATAREATAEREVRGLAAQQRENVAQLADLLSDRGWPIDFGGYPTDYTDLHFLSLDFFLPRLAAAQAAVVAELDEAVHSCIDDPAAVELLRNVLSGERDIAARLNALVSSLKAPTAA